ncbi:putative adenosine deaminase [Aspergillus homomorphus CBS 101889]|uniref:Uncharacterized protein n=1 Tax=Aspergillus homomorphus (strain CBS 101889) TaxID=1450537 RepID=A0A395IAE7_ASPHC|nr:hypothetical protein BO97DRAFT_84529 [Aspergillus homomorphus CBS 101889]RAL17137.1 hypothetical protein BO97DRAFT_84529 [Aspergillus homomorphus CBS 101889]
MSLLSFGPARLGHVVHVLGHINCNSGEGWGWSFVCRVMCTPGLWRGVSRSIIWVLSDSCQKGKTGCPVVHRTDRVGFFCSAVSNELLTTEHFHLSRAEVSSLCTKSYSVTLGGAVEKERLFRLLNGFKADYRA